jgi:hypothetical protein
VVSDQFTACLCRFTTLENSAFWSLVSSIQRLQPTMVNRPRRSGLTQTFAIPHEDDIYEDASIASLDELGPTKDTDSPGLHDISETLAAFLDDANTPTIDSQSTAPPSPSPVTPATVTGAQCLKRKRDSNTPYRGLGQKDKAAEMPVIKQVIKFSRGAPFQQTRQGWFVLNNGQSVQTLLCYLPMVALCYLWLHSVALCYLLLHIGEDHTPYI